ncbi:MAG: hypothetical protein M3X11_17515 [Acidobacteriota bacterium]|nr:hypothetical protein [Acidobacteriota bacterium]
MSETNDNSQNQSYQKLLDELMSRSQGVRSIQTTYRIVMVPDDWKNPGSLIDILGAPKEYLTEQATMLLEFLEQKSFEANTLTDWVDFKWKLLAFFEIQDVFDAQLHDLLKSKQESALNMFHIWYFYFESRNLLAESILCGLQGLYSASSTMLRLFLEFNLLQLYYYHMSNQTHTFKLLEDYFGTGIHPSWNTVLQRSIPDDAFCRPIKVRLDLHHKSLSKSAVHAYHPDFSPRQHSASVALPSFEGIFFWYSTRLMLQAVLWAYYVNFPMLFHPRDLLKKFGFGGPVGLFVDQTCATAVKRSLKDDEYQEFLQHSQRDGNVAALTSWYEEQSDLTEEQIRVTWNSENHGTLGRIFPEGYAQQTAHQRAIKEIMALKRPDADAKDRDEKVVEDLGDLTYSKWKKMYKRLSK